MVLSWGAVCVAGLLVTVTGFGGRPNRELGISRFSPGCRVCCGSPRDGAGVRAALSLLVG